MDLEEWFPDKPKGMHWKTYAKLADKGLALEKAADQEFLGFMERLVRQ
jgi:hypothetical protein